MKLEIYQTYYIRSHDQMYTRFEVTANKFLTLHEQIEIQRNAGYDPIAYGDPSSSSHQKIEDKFKTSWWCDGTTGG